MSVHTAFGLETSGTLWREFWILRPLGRGPVDRSAEANSTDPPGKDRVKARKGMDHLEEDVKILRDGLRG